MDFVIRFLTAGAIFAVLDAVWLSTMINTFYKTQIGSLLADKPNMLAAVIFYIIYIIGITVFVVNPAISAGSWLIALGLGALFGAVCYATYDLTNAATLKDWPMTLVFVDIAWGMFATAVTSVLTYVVLTR